MSLPVSDLNKKADGLTTMELGKVLPLTAEVKDDHLFIGGCDMVEIAKEFGTALYVFDQADLEARMDEYVQSFKKFYGDRAEVAYASKAFQNKAIVQLANEHGMCLDVSGGGELACALAAGFPAKRVVVHGNNKTPQELREAIEAGVGCIVVDSRIELGRISAIAQELGVTQDIYMRITPGVEADTHEFIRTGGIDSKFGVALENGEAFALLEKAAAYEHLHIIGLECHIGSQIFDTEPFALAARVMLSFMNEVREKLGLRLGILDLGGGYGIRYTDADNPPARADYIRIMTDTVKDICGKLGMEPPFLLIEPGRSIVGDAGLTLYRVGSVKRIEGVRTYVAVDGGMGDNPRYTMYGSPYDMVIANKAALPKDTVVTVAGRYCETDLLQEHIPLQQAEPGDCLAVLATGAYNYSMASNYNRVPRPPLVLVRDGEDRLAVRREQYADMVRCDVCE